MANTAVNIKSPLTIGNPKKDDHLKEASSVFALTTELEQNVERYNEHIEEVSNRDPLTYLNIKKID